MRIHYYGKEYELYDNTQIVATDANGVVWGYEVLFQYKRGWLGKSPQQAIRIDAYNHEAKKDWKNSIRLFKIDDGGDGPVRSPGRRVQTEKSIYTPTEIEGKRHLFRLNGWLSLRIDEVEDRFRVICDELGIHCKAMESVESALFAFAVRFEELYEKHVKGQKKKSLYGQRKIEILFRRAISDVQEL